jgi:hypothetical protein
MEGQHKASGKHNDLFFTLIKRTIRNCFLKKRFTIFKFFGEFQDEVQLLNKEGH